jgi:membrane-associated phospholipid phosphatase
MGKYFISLTLFTLLIVELVFLPLLIPLDSFVQQWLQDFRYCDLDRLALFVKNWTSSPYLYITIVGTAACVLVYQRRWKDIIALSIIAIGGALLCEWLKLFVARPRPSSLAFINYGNSFPSGHVTNSVTLFGAIYYAAFRDHPGKRWIRLSALSGIFVVITIIGLQRLYFTHHWLTDVIGSCLLGLGWLFFATARFSRPLAVKSLGVTCVIFAFAFLTVRLFPTLQFVVPSPISARGTSTNRADLAAYVPSELEAASAEIERGAPAIAVWNLRGPKTNINLPLSQQRDYMVVFAIAPQSKSRKLECHQLEVLINDRPVKRTVLYEGFRDYTFRMDKQLVSADTNRLTFTLLTAERAKPALVYLEAFPQ